MLNIFSRVSVIIEAKYQAKLFSIELCPCSGAAEGLDGLLGIGHAELGIVERGGGAKEVEHAQLVRVRAVGSGAGRDLEGGSIGGSVGGSIGGSICSSIGGSISESIGGPIGESIGGSIGHGSAIVVEAIDGVAVGDLKHDEQ